MNHGRRNTPARPRTAGGAGVNSAEGFYSQLKRGIDGTHHHVSIDAPAPLVAEYDFRYSLEKSATRPPDMKAIQQAGGKRLTYRDPTDR